MPADRGTNDNAITGSDRSLWRRVVNSACSYFTKSVRSFRVGADLYSVSKANKVISDRIVPPLVQDTTMALVDRGIANGPGAGSDQSLWRHVVNSPFSRFTKSIRSIKIATELYGVSKANKVIGMTSSLPNEGKSTIAAAVTQLISRSGSRAILVDADLRNPYLSRWLAPDAVVGMVEVISGAASLEDAIWWDDATNTAFLPTVARTRLAHTSDLLGSASTMELFKRLRQDFDYVIVDLSPLTPVVDVRATGDLVNSYVFVIEWGRTKIDVVHHALGAARVVCDNLIGIVLNKANISTLSRYENHGTNYYHSRYHSRYAYTD